MAVGPKKDTLKALVVKRIPTSQNLWAAVLEAQLSSGKSSDTIRRGSEASVCWAPNRSKRNPPTGSSSSKPFGSVVQKGTTWENHGCHNYKKLVVAPCPRNKTITFASHRYLPTVYNYRSDGWTPNLLDAEQPTPWSWRAWWYCCCNAISPSVVRCRKAHRLLPAAVHCI